MAANCGRSLNEIVQLIQTGFDYCAAQCFEAMHIERDVVVHKKDAAGAVIACVADVCEHTFERISMKVPAPHFNDRTEAAVISAAT